MAYEKTVWKNNEAPKINATNLNKMENGIANAVATDSIARVNNVVSRNLYNKNNSYRTGANNQNIANDISLKPNTSYYFNTGKTWTEIKLYNNEGTLTRDLGNTEGTTSIQFNTNSNEVKGQFSFYAGAETNVETYDFTGIQLEEGIVGTSYTPYLNLEEAMQPKGVTLFDGATGGNVVLSDTPSNYNTLDIYYNVASSTLVQTVKANSAYFVLTLSEIDNSNSGNMGIVNYYKQYVVNGNTLTAAAAGRLFKYQMDTNVVQDKVDYLWIMKVISYK